MLSLPSIVEVYFCTEVTDMRKSFDGLSTMVKDIIKQNPLSGHLFIFLNRRKDRIKLLWWDSDGFVIWYKRLEEGTFKMPDNSNAQFKISQRDLSMMLEGIDFKTIRKNHRYQR